MRHRGNPGASQRKSRRVTAELLVAPPRNSGRFPGRFTAGLPGAAPASACWRRPDRHHGAAAVPTGGTWLAGVPPGRSGHCSPYSGTMSPDRQSGAELYWRRRVIVLVVILVMVGLWAWSCSAPSPAARSVGQVKAARTPQVTATTPSPAATPPATPAPRASKQHHRAKRKHAAKHAGHAKRTKRAHLPGGTCAPDAVVITLRESQQVYPQPADPQFTVYVVNAGRHACTLNAVPRLLRLVIESGPAHVWSTADCAHASKPHIIRLAHGVPWVKHFSWNRTRSSPGCPALHETAQPGTYTARVSDGRVHSQTVIFLLR